METSWQKILQHRCKSLKHITVKISLFVKNLNLYIKTFRQRELLAQMTSPMNSIKHSREK